MSGWTSEQLELLHENAHKGAKVCAELIAKRTGVRRSVEATRRKLYREGLSVVPEPTVCPACGRATWSQQRETGLCPVCHRRYLAERQRRIREARRAERERSGELAEAEREYARERKRTSRDAQG